LILKFSLLRVLIIFSLVVLLPLIQNQWLNLYLFDINNFTIYKFLYFISGLICPILVCLNSLNSFTSYKIFKNKNKTFVSGKLLFLITSILLILLSTLIHNYIFININLIFNRFIIGSNGLLHVELDKYLLIVLVISFLLIFKKVKLLIKKIILVNYFIFSTVIWYLKINEILLNDSYLFNNILKIDNINYINIFLLLLIEIVYFIWSYVSNGSNLSDWKIQIPTNHIFVIFFNIIIFYLLVIFYYSMLSG